MGQHSCCVGSQDLRDSSVLHGVSLLEVKMYIGILQRQLKELKHNFIDVYAGLR